MLGIFFTKLKRNYRSITFLGAPVRDRLKNHFDAKPFLFIVIQKYIICNALLHSLIVVIDNFLQVNMNDLLHNLSVKHHKIRQLFLEWLNLIIYCHGIDDAVHPDCLNVCNVRRINLVVYVRHVAFINQLLSQHFCLQLFFFTVIQISNFRGVFVQQHLPVNYFFLVRCKTFLIFARGFETMKISVFVNQDFLFWMDIKAHTF